MTDKDKITFDERRKILNREQVDNLPVYGDKKYGEVERTFKTNLTEKGIKKVISQMNADKKQFQQDLNKQKDMIEGAEKQKKLDEDSVKKLNKEIELIKKEVGSRISWKISKNNEKDKLDGKDKKKQGTRESNKTKQ